MARINIFNVPRADIDTQIEFQRTRLVAYLLRVRGPGPSELNPVAPEWANPTGEVARSVWREYELPYEPKIAANLPANYMDILHNGGNWTLGAPMRSPVGTSAHDAVEDLNGYRLCFGEGIETN